MSTVNFVPWYMALYGIAAVAVAGYVLGPTLCIATATAALVLMVTFGIMEWNEQRHW